MSGVLRQLVDELNRGTVRVVDLTQPLGPSTPVIALPPTFAASPGATIDVISRYDDKGPAWYWNTLRFGEHTGTHFDAPVHWVSGKDLPNNATVSIPPERFIGPAFVLDCSKEAARDAAAPPFRRNAQVQHVRLAGAHRQHAVAAHARAGVHHHAVVAHPQAVREYLVIPRECVGRALERAYGREVRLRHRAQLPARHGDVVTRGGHRRAP